jgi:hypothetical protein
MQYYEIPSFLSRRFCLAFSGVFLKEGAVYGTKLTEPSVPGISDKIGKRLKEF